MITIFLSFLAICIGTGAWIVVRDESARIDAHIASFLAAEEDR